MPNISESERTLAEFYESKPFRPPADWSPEERRAVLSAAIEKVPRETLDAYRKAVRDVYAATDAIRAATGDRESATLVIIQLNGEVYRER